MKALTKDARGFVIGVVNYLKKEGKGNTGPRVHSLLYRMTAAAKRERQATVESSVALTSGEKQEIARILATLTGHPVAINSRVKGALVGGLRIKLADWVIDTSLESQLEKMAEVV